MAKQITYQAPCYEGKGKKRTITWRTMTGTPVLLYVGNYQHCFAIQHGLVKKLVDIESGLVLGDINDAAIRRMCAVGGGAPTDREAAKYLIQLLTAKHGADAINAKLKQQRAEIEQMKTAEILQET